MKISNFLPLGIPPQIETEGAEETLWKTLQTFCFYRTTVAIILLIGFWGFQRYQVVGTVMPELAAWTLAFYLLLSIAAWLLVRVRKPSPPLQVFIQVTVDIVAITLVMHASGGVKSGIGLMLLVTLAAAGLVSRGRIAFFHAAFAALSILFEQAWLFVYYEAGASDFFQSGLLAFSCFIIVGLWYTLAKYARGAEQIAEARGVDLANMAEINELVIRDMQDGFIVVDQRGMIRQHNEQSEALVGVITPGRTRTLLECVPQLAVFLEEWRRDVRHVFPVIRSASTQKEFQVRMVAIGAVQPAPTVIFLEDAGRIRAQAQQLKLAALGRLTASIAHEIRNPLSSINHASELLLEDAHRTDTDRRLLNIIRDNAHRLDQMVEEVLNLNRRDRMHPESIDLVAYLKQFVREFCANEKIDPARLSSVIQSTKHIRFDRSHLDQILWNLLRNAVRHGSLNHDGVVIHYRDAGSESVALEVKNDGPSIPPEILPHLFEPFFTTDVKGTGLGLYIGRELAEVNGALLDYVYNENRADLVEASASGACFRLTIKSHILSS